jgi:Rrf2 family protein
MLKISSSIEYATRIMVFLGSSNAEGPLSAERLSESENIPRDYVNQLLLRLRRAGLVVSQRGAHGGYNLSRRPEDISIGQIVTAVEEGSFQDVCNKYAGGDQQCNHSDDCGIRPVWQRISFMVEGFLNELPLSELLKEQVQVESRVRLLFQGKSSTRGSSR